MIDYATYEARLHQLRDEMMARIDAIENDVHHREQPVEKDFAEQATQSENDDVLNALDDEAKMVVQQIDHALLRIKDSSYGVCEKCGEPISEKRLEAIPYTSLCIKCAD